MTRHPAARTSDHPVVGVTATIAAENDGRRVRLNTGYVDALEAAGCVPIIIPPLAGDDAELTFAIGRILSLVRGLVLTGGEDVDPARYRAKPSPHLTTINAARDRTEIAAALGARQRLLPTLAICRGMQLVNVTLGGTLVQDIPSERPSAVAHDPDTPRTTRTHAVRLASGSRAARSLGTTDLSVNSMHHQALDRVAAGLVVSGTSADGLVEAIETAETDPWWLLGVQWHPEEFANERAAADQGLFAAFRSALDRAAVTIP